MIHRICFDGHFSSIKTLVEKLRRCFQALPHLIYIIKYRVQSFKMPILHRVQNGQSKFLTMMKPKTHKKVQKKKNLFSIFALKSSRDSIIPPNCAEEKKRRYPARHSRAQNSTLSQREREKERKKERRSHRARGGGGAGAGRGVVFQKRIKL